MSQTFADNLLPSSTGYDLGSTTQRWDAFLQNINLSGALTLANWTGYANVKEYGALGDGRAVTSAVATSGNTTLVDTTASPWVAADVGKTIVIYSQTYSPGLVTTISAFTDSSHVVLASAPTSSATVNAVWGTDDTTAIAAAVAAITATGSIGTLYFPQGIYFTSSTISIANAQGLSVCGQGAASAMSLGNYNASGQPATGTAIVWMGAQGTTVGDAGENFLLRLSGQFHLHDIALCGSQLVSHNLQCGGSGTSTSFGWSVARTNSGYARQYGLVVGGTGSDQGSNFGEASVRDMFLGGNGIPNTAAAESDETGGGDIFVRYGSGNYQVTFDTISCNSATGVNGNHRVYWYSGNFGSFNNSYFSPLTGNSAAHSSMYVKAGNFFTFNNHYDENGYMVHVSASGASFRFNQVQLRQQATTNPHFGMLFDGVTEADFNGVSTSGLPIVFNAGGRVSRNNVIEGNIGSTPAYPFTLCSGAGCITRSGSTVTVTTTATHSYVAGDWISLAGIADATYNGTFKVTAPVTATTFDVVNANAVGASTQSGTVGLAGGIVANTATNYIPQYSHPFISHLESFNGSGTLADILANVSTNIAHKNAITMINGSTAGSNGASLPATIPAGWNFLDMRGGTPIFYGTTFGFGSATNPSTVNLGRMKVAGAVPTCTFTSGGGTTPSCTVETGSTDLAGTIVATTGTGSPGTSGTITLTFSSTYGTNKPAYVATLSNDGAGTWNARATVITETPSTTSVLFNWDNNAVALSTSTAYHISYCCIAK